MDDVSALLRLELDTLWVTDSRGRMGRVRTPEPRPAPLLAVAAGTRSLVWACSTLVPDDLAAEVGATLEAERHEDETATVGWRPGSAESLVGLMARSAPVGKVERGTSFVLDRMPALYEGVDCWLSTDVEPQRLSGLMSEDDRRSLRPPWAVAIVNDAVAAVCETARWAPNAAEPGVWTYEEFRRRGLASATVAEWTRLVERRTIFYSTTHDNLASQGVARRLGLRPLGQWWCVYADEPEQL